MWCSETCQRYSGSGSQLPRLSRYPAPVPTREASAKTASAGEHLTHIRLRPTIRLTQFHRNHRSLKALLSLFCIALCSRVADVGRIYGWISHWLPTSEDACRANLDLERDVREAVLWAAGIVPGTTCATRSLAIIFLHAYAGHRSYLRIGVRRSSSGRMYAHAWVVNGAGAIISETN